MTPKHGGTVYYNATDPGPVHRGGSKARGTGAQMVVISGGDRTYGRVEDGVESGGGEGRDGLWRGENLPRCTGLE